MVTLQKNSLIANVLIESWFLYQKNSVIVKIICLILDSEAKSDKVERGLESTIFDDKIEGKEHNEKYVKIYNY